MTAECSLPHGPAGTNWGVFHVKQGEKGDAHAHHM